MAEAKFFRVVGRHNGFVKDDLTDIDENPQFKGISGGVTITAATTKRRQVLKAATLTPNPSLISLWPFEVKLDDGRLKIFADAEDPEYDQPDVRLVAKCSALGLDDDEQLIYTFTPHDITANGKRQTLPAFTIVAPEIPDSHDDDVDGEITKDWTVEDWVAPALTNGLIIRQVPDDVTLDGDAEEIQFYSTGGVPLGDPLDISALIFRGNIDTITDAEAAGKEIVRSETTGEAQTALGGSTSGKTVFSGTAAQGRTALGASATGDSVFTGDAAAGRTALTAATRTEIYYAKDYGVVADGVTNNASTLNGLITTVSNAGGGVVLLPIGTMVTNGAISMKSNVVLRGHGWKSILKLGANINGFGVINIDGVSDVVIESLKIDGNRGTLTQVNSGIQGGSTSGTPLGYSDVLVRDVWVHSPAYAGIMFLGSSTRAVEVKNIRVQDCKVTNAGGHGILGQWGVDQCWFERNTVIGHALVTVDCLGICNGRFAYDTAMNDNYIDSTGAVGSSSHAISIDTPYARFTCHGNTVVNAVGFGIEIAMGVNGSVTGNHITGGASAGIKFTGNEAGYPGVSNLGVTVANNVIDGSVGGINFHMGEFTANQAIPGSRTILRNIAYTATSLTRAVDGRRLYECTTAGTTHATVKPAAWGTTNTGETVTDGTTVWTDRGATHAQLVITGNAIRNIVGIGLEMRYAHGVSITSNVITACTLSGIYVDSNANMFTITDNEIYGNNLSADAAHGGIRIIGHSTASKVAKIGPNRVKDNILNQDIVVVDSVSGVRLDNRFPIGVAQPTVAYGNTFFTQNTGATTITHLRDTNDIDGRMVVVRVNDANTTFAHAASGTETLRLTGGVNYVAPSGAVLVFSWSLALQQWLEISRTTAFLPATATLNFGSVAAQSFADLTITVTGAAAGDCVSLGVPTAAVTAGIAYTGWVSATNTVTVRAHNYTAGALDPASGTFKAAILR